MRVDVARAKFFEKQGFDVPLGRSLTEVNHHRQSGLLTGGDGSIDSRPTGSRVVCSLKAYDQIRVALGYLHRSLDIHLRRIVLMPETHAFGDDVEPSEHTRLRALNCDLTKVIEVAPARRPGIDHCGDSASKRKRIRLHTLVPTGRRIARTIV